MVGRRIFVADAASVRADAGSIRHGPPTGECTAEFSRILLPPSHVFFRLPPSAFRLRRRHDRRAGLRTRSGGERDRSPQRAGRRRDLELAVHPARSRTLGTFATAPPASGRAVASRAADTAAGRRPSLAGIAQLHRAAGCRAAHGRLAAAAGSLAGGTVSPRLPPRAAGGIHAAGLSGGADRPRSGGGRAGSHRFGRTGGARSRPAAARRRDFGPHPRPARRPRRSARRFGSRPGFRRGRHRVRVAGERDRPAGRRAERRRRVAAAFHRPHGLAVAGSRRAGGAAQRGEEHAVQRLDRHGGRAGFPRERNDPRLSAGRA